jgi:3-phenylpropionate/cinnamic acid dioxygenase small subunit
MALSSEDRFQIAELNSRFFFALDNHDLDAWSATFTEAGVFASPYGEFPGHEQRTEFLRGHIDAGREDGTRHMTVDLAIDDAGDRARMRSYVVKLQVEQAPHIVATGVYEDELVRTGEGWRFARRALSIDPGAFAAQADAP